MTLKNTIKTNLKLMNCMWNVHSSNQWKATPIGSTKSCTPPPDSTLQYTLMSSTVVTYGKKKGNGVGVYVFLMHLSQPLVVGKVHYYEINLSQLKIIWANTWHTKILQSFQQSNPSTKIFLSDSEHFQNLESASPVIFASQLGHNRAFFFTILSTHFHLTRQLRSLFGVLLEIIRH